MVKVILLLCLAGLVFGQSDSLILQPDAAAGYDAEIYGSGYASRNYGVRIETTFMSNYDSKQLILFDLSSIPAGSVIDSAYITHTLWFQSYTSVFYSAAILQLWREGNKNHTGATSGEVTYNHCRYDTLWGTAGCNLIGTDRTAPLDSQVVATGSLPRQEIIDITQTLRYIFAAPNNYGLVQWAPDARQLLGYSSDNATPSNRLKLSVYYRAEAPATGAKWREVVIDGKLQTWRTQ